MIQFNCLYIRFSKKINKYNTSQSPYLLHIASVNKQIMKYWEMS